MRGKAVIYLRNDRSARVFLAQPGSPSTAPAVQLRRSVPSRPPLTLSRPDNTTAPRPPPGLLASHPYWTGCWDSIKSKLHCQFKNSFSWREKDTTTSYVHIDFQKHNIRKKSSIKLQIFQLPGCHLAAVFLITVILTKLPKSGSWPGGGGVC